jgi:hypothetical protein
MTLRDKFATIEYVLVRCEDKLNQGYKSNWVSLEACAGGCEYAIIGKKNRVGEQLVECKLKKEQILIKKKERKKC